jgi:hypothetical protein
MIDVIHKATMADSWKAEVEKQMEGQKEIIPLLLSGFYTLAPTGFDFGEKDSGGKDSIPVIQKLLNTPPIFAGVNKYLKIKQDENALDMKPVVAIKREQPDWVNVDPNNEDFLIEEVFEIRPLKFNFPILSLFTQIGIRRPTVVGSNVNNSYCVWPACQPNVNNRLVPMDWIWNPEDDDETVIKTALVNGIVERGDLAWTAQKVNFLPYEVCRPSTVAEKTEAPLFHIISDTTSGTEDKVRATAKKPKKKDEEASTPNPEGEEDSTPNPENEVEEVALQLEDSGSTPAPTFDGNLHAKIVSFEVAAQAYLALCVSFHHLCYLLIL